MLNWIKNNKWFQQESFYSWLIFTFLIGQGLLIAFTSVNIPAGDDWELLRSNGLINGFSLNYVFAFHNEHRIVFTKLLDYFFLNTTGLNFKYQIIFNYFIFSAIVLFIMSFQKKYISDATKGIWILPFFLVSPLIVDNHNWAIQSCFHFCILFGLLSIFLATKEELKLSNFWLAGLLALCSMYSLAAGIFIVFIVFCVLGYRTIFAGNITKTEFVFRLLALVSIVVGVGIWFIDLPHPEGHPPFTWPYHFEFWYFYANLISLGFGYKTSNFVVAFISLGIVVFILLKSYKKAFSFKNFYISFPFFGALAVLAAYASIALTRTGFGIGQAKTSRYGELGMFLVPFIGYLFWDLAKQSPRIQKGFKYFIWFVCLGFLGDYGSYLTYFEVENVRKEALICISGYYSGLNPTGDCPTIYPGPLKEMLDNAKKLNLSWVPEN